MIEPVRTDEQAEQMRIDDVLVVVKDAQGEFLGFVNRRRVPDELDLEMMQKNS